MRGQVAAVGLLVSLLAGPPAVQAQEASRSFSVRAGSARERIAEFAGQARVDLLASADTLAGIRTNEVTGTMPVAQALHKLLAGTGLAARFDDSGAVFIVAAPPAAQAAPPPAVLARAAPEPLAQVNVNGTRLSQQSAISGKKLAATAVDMIVADDVGSFPDRNVAEAISRIAGVSLERGDFGEGRNVDVRGNGPDLIRFELDGMGLMAAGGTDMNLGGFARGVELRDLSSDLIASLAVTKGATPDMTEGSLGGGIVIRTRTGLDFQQRHLSARIAASKSSLNERWTPSLNLVYADKFMDKRLGVVLTLARTRLFNEGHFNQNNNSGVSGNVRNADFDGSLEKTFVFQPQTLSSTDPAVMRPLLRAPLAAGGTLDFDSPMELLTKAANAGTKEACFAAFPAPSEQQLAAMSEPSVRAAAASHQSDALLTCLNQWNDYTPPQIRNIIKRNADDRLNAQLRLDFKLNRKLSVFAKWMRSERTVVDEFLSLDRGSPQVGGAPGAAGAGVGGYSRLGSGVTEGVATTIVPSSVVVDATHHVTSFVMNDGGYFVDNIYNPMKSRSRYAQAGGSWRAGSFKADVLLGASDASFRRADTRLNGVGYLYGQARLTAQPDGSWAFDILNDQARQSDPARYTQLFAQADPRQPRFSRTALLSQIARIGEAAEVQAKLDMAWSPALVRLPFLGTQKFGLNRRRYDNTSWSATPLGVTVAASTPASAAVTLPATQVRIGISACQPGQGIDAVACPDYGYRPGSGVFSRRGNYTLAPEDFTRLIAQLMSTHATSRYFDGADGRPTGLVDSWTELDVKQALALLPAPGMGFDCLKSCLASDGQRYTQPSVGLREKIDVGYWMTDFDVAELPWVGRLLPHGMELNGNFGWRYVRSHVTGRAQMNFTSIAKTAGWDRTAPYASAGIDVMTVLKDTAITRTTTDIMPMLNLMFWPLKDELALRYSRSKTIARQPVGNLLPAGSCTYDEVAADTPGDMQCTGDFGNPGLKPATNINHNLSLEWYADKDTLLSVSAFRFKGIVGGVRRETVSNARLFEGAGISDPLTGTPLDGISYTYSTLVNGTPSERRGWEVAAKVAFTGMPWPLRHAGLDANYSRSKPKIIGSPRRDLLTGDFQDPPFVPRSTWNASLWYDDGKFSARAALQVVASMFTALGPWYATGTSLRNYPAPGASALGLPWSPGSANYNEATRYLDLRLAWQYRDGIELFGEVRNAGRRMVIRSQGDYNHYASGAKTVNEFVYTGSRATLGLNVKL